MDLIAKEVEGNESASLEPSRLPYTRSPCGELSYLLDGLSVSSPPALRGSEGCTLALECSVVIGSKCPCRHLLRPEQMAGVNL